QLNYELQLNNVVVVAPGLRGRSPKSFLIGVEITLDDGTTISASTPAQEHDGDPATIHPDFKGRALSFGSIRNVRLRVNTQQLITQGVAAARVLLAVKLNGESRYLDASLVAATPLADYDGASFFSLSHAPELDLLERELMDHQLYYSQQIWLRENPQNMLMQ